ncbi:hypothetical protein EVAR_26501_1 [Eumeta japonica]|uniref:Uncharacterized protein n=1 Tax=Eumeta variegata TaxID=151549 RepID=A0A4C1V7S1_EUMVA|nr:hypothetical protein EVAR_26501_1 [Eumeta japonica]
MTSMNPPQVMIMSVGREDEENLIKMTGSNKLDKSGVVKSDVVDGKIKAKAEKLHNSATRKSEKNVEAKASTLSGENEKLFTKINITEHTPNRIRPNKIIRKNTVNRSSGNIFLNTMNSVK